MNQEQKIAILKTAMAFFEQHRPSIESYTKYYFPKFISFCIRKNKLSECTVENFFDSIPEHSLIPRAQTELEEGYKEVYESFKKLLDELEQKIHSSESENNDITG